MKPDPDALAAVLPDPADETPPEPPQAASETQDEPQTASEGEGDPSDAPEGEEIVVTAPVFPLELRLRWSKFWVQRTPNGGRLLKIVPAAPSESGLVPAALPAYVLELDAAGWEAFRAEIENDGAPRADITIASHLPHGARLG